MYCVHETRTPSYWVAAFLLHGAIGLISAEPACPAVIPRDQAPEWRRQKRLELERLPADRLPMLVAFAETYSREPDPDRYFGFGIDLLMAAVEAKARTKVG